LLNGLLKKYPKFEIIVNISEISRPLFMWTDITLKLKKKLQKSKVNDRIFDLTENYTQKQFIKDVQKIHKARFENEDVDSDSDDED
jgi:hypothetical protein